MSDTTLYYLWILALLGCGLMSGVFFAFSTAIMGGLARLEGTQGMAAMQSINRVIVNPLLCVVLIVLTIRKLPNPNAVWVVAGAAAYLVALLITVTINIPLNDALENAKADSSSAAQWSTNVSTWKAWNHVRGIFSLIVTLLLAISRP